MKQLRLVLASVAIAGAGAWAIVAVACDKNSATAANAACPTMTAAECKARMAAGQTCPGASGSATAVTAAMNGQCSGHGASATTASMKGSCAAHGAKTASASGCAHDASAVTAASARCPYSGATAAAGGECAGHAGATDAMTISQRGGKTAGACSAHGATAAAAGHDCCAGKGANAATTASRGCPDHNVSAMAAGLGSNCGGHEGHDAMTHVECDACADLASCDAELQAAGASMQTVPIKNGVMFVYTASAPGQVNAIQSVMARRSEHLSRIVSAGTQAHLCADCKSMRGAMASGRLIREVVNIEGGTLVLVTSSDPALVKRIRNLADAGKTAVKS